MMQTSQCAAISLDPLGAADIMPLTGMMAAAFDADAPTNPDFDRQLLDPYHRDDFFVRLPPGCCEAEQYALHLGAATAGAAVIWHFAAYDAVLGLYFVTPTLQHQGVGRVGWALLEARYPEVQHWEVAAPRWSPATIRFYERQCGFHAVGASTAYLSLAKDRP